MNIWKYIVVFLSVVALTIAIGDFTISNALNNGGRYVVSFDDPLNQSAKSALEDRGQILQELEIINGAVVVLPTQAAVDQVGSLEGVNYIEPDYTVKALHHRPGHDGGPPGSGGGDDDGGSTQPAQVLEWGVDRIDAELAWSSSTGSGVNVAIVDTGIDLDHADLNVSGGVDCTRGPNCSKGGNGDDDNGHGTHVAGIVSALNNDIGVVGVAHNANLYSVKVLKKDGSGFVSDVVEGIEWSINNNMNVINMSLGSDSHSQSLQDALDQAYGAGIVNVAAAGNDGDGDGSTDDVDYPARYDSVIAVSATDKDDSTPVWSSEGPDVEVAAPGVDVRSTWNDGLYNTISGTSMASPHTAGAAALVIATPISSTYDADSDGVWDPIEVRNVLQSTADDLGPSGEDNFFGHGLVDAEESATGSQTSN